MQPRFKHPCCSERWHLLSLLANSASRWTLACFPELLQVLEVIPDKDQTPTAHESVRLPSREVSGLHALLCFQAAGPDLPEICTCFAGHPLSAPGAAGLHPTAASNAVSPNCSSAHCALCPGIPAW